MDLEQAVSCIIQAQPLALATDFDGTLSEIAPTPQQAAIHPRCRAGLVKLTEVLPLVAVVSGRHVDDVRQLVDVHGVVYLGNHGLERWENGTTYVEPSASQQFLVIRGILEAAREELDLPGVVFEEKTTGASVHYRLAPRPAAARKRIASCLRALTAGTGIRVAEGRRVVELRPPIDANKGTALIGLLRSYKVHSVVYAGDDRTDLDAFAGIRRWAHQGQRRALAVAVISPEMPPELRKQADLTVDGVEGWAAFLDTLSEALAAAPRR